MSSTQVGVVRSLEPVGRKPGALQLSFALGLPGEGNTHDQPDVLRNAFEKNRGVQHYYDNREANWLWRNCILKMLFALG